jgi:ParB-like chromosome segregation protein Spo0J
VEEGVMGQQEKICDYVIHAAASVFPLLEGDRFQSLVDSIAAHGVQNPIVSFKGEVLDGRNRLRAVMKLRDEGHKVDLPCVEWDAKCGMSATEWVAAQNLDRRHLSADAYVTATAAINRILRKEAKERQKAGQAKPGKPSKNPAGRGASKTGSHETVRTRSRNHKQEHARSSVGQVAAKAGASMHKARQAVKLDQAVEAGVVSEQVQRDVVAGKRKLKDVVASLPSSNPPKRKAKAKRSDLLDKLRLLLSEIVNSDSVDATALIEEMEVWIGRIRNR